MQTAAKGVALLLHMDGVRGIGNKHLSTHGLDPPFLSGINFRGHYHLREIRALEATQES